MIEQWTTVDPNRTNVREKAVQKLLQGFSLYIVLMGKNNAYENKIEARWRDTLIVCTIMPSSGPVDVEGMLYLSTRGRNSGFGGGDPLEEMENRMDCDVVRKGVVRWNKDQKTRSKGPSPSDQDQKDWAPFLYFVHAVAGTIIAMMHKMGMFRLRINYGVKMVINYLADHLLSTLSCLIVAEDERGSSRYRSACICRGVGETVLRMTFSSMLRSKDVDAATLHAINSLTYNAVHPCVLPSLMERLIQRLIQFEPMLGMATLGIMLQVPVVSMQSILELTSGQQVSNEEEADAMRNFVVKCLEGRDGLCMLPFVGMDEYSSAQPGKLSGYISCPGLIERFVSSSAASGSGGHQGRQQQNQGQQNQGQPSMMGGYAPNGVPMEPVVNISKRIWMSNHKVMTNCAFVKDFLGFHRCIYSLMKPYNLRQFFGGMSMYHDGEAMAKALGIPHPERFASDFSYGVNGGADPLMLPSRISSGAAGSSSDVEYCLSLRVWDLFLWFSMMHRPRRDVGIMLEMAKTLAHYAMQLLPKSIFPFALVPMGRADSVDRSHVLMDMLNSRDDAPLCRPLVLPRSKNETITTPNFQLVCAGKIGAGILEDEMYMSEIIMMAEDIGMTNEETGILEWYKMPLQEISSTLNIFWEWGVSYPMARYFEPGESQHGTDGGEEDTGHTKHLTFAIMYMDPNRFSMMIWAPSAAVEGLPWDDESIVNSTEMVLFLVYDCTCHMCETDTFCIQELFHEFSLLPQLPCIQGQQTLGCKDMQHMQTRLFAHGLGPIPLFRRPGVLLR